MMEERLQELRAEYDRGLRQMAELDRRRQELQYTLLRINGAIQVLTELIAKGQLDESGDRAPSPIRAVGT